MLYELDLNYGRINELKNINKIEIFFNEKIIELDYYNEFDFTNAESTLLIELKSRRCKFYDYNDTIISVSKINKAKKISKNKLIKVEILCNFNFRKKPESH